MSPRASENAVRPEMPCADAYERSVIGFRSDPRMRHVVEENYLDEDLGAAVSRYARGDEFARLSAIMRANLPSGGTLLDVGAGRGLTSLAFAGDGFQVIGVEHDASDVVGLGALARFEGRRAVPLAAVRGDALRLPFADATFDAVFCRSVLHHLSKLGRGLEQIFRVLKPGGLLLASNEHILSPFSTGKDFLKAHPAVAYGVDERAYSAWRYRAELRRAGFRNIRFFGFPVAFPEFLQLTKGNRVRAALVAAPLIGSWMARLLYVVHVVMRRYLFVPEEMLPAVSIVASKPGARHRRRMDRTCQGGKA